MLQPRKRNVLDAQKTLDTVLTEFLSDEAGQFCSMALGWHVKRNINSYRDR